MIIGTILPLLAAACVDTPDPPVPPEPEEELETVAYTASDENFPNPERGFYSSAEVHSADGKGISQPTITAARLQGRTLFLLEFHLTNYVNCDIADEYLATIRAKFESLREGGV